MSRLRLVAFVLVLVAVLAAIRLLPVQAWSAALVNYVRDAGAAGVAIFAAAYVLSTVAMLPGSILTLGAGFAYGPLWGLIITSPVSVVAATTAFMLGRHALRDRAQRALQSSARLQAVIRGVEREGLRLVILLRLSPLVPFNVLNYALGLTRIRPRDYILGSFVGMLPGTALYVYLGSLASTVAALGEARGETSPAQWVLYGVGLVATVVVVIVAGRAARRAMAEHDPAGA